MGFYEMNEDINSFITKLRCVEDQLNHLTPPADKPHIDALAELLDARGLNADDFIQIVDIHGTLKKKESDNIKKEKKKEPLTPQ